ncbi:shikimate dehydrogenase [Terrisporobacter mayombei]|uniref:Shikimate dehydrogenase (NADP(+)) n=1 Tax=Terrisporobacter mayombei TaxID=1541 RepID=A0ABY9Q0P3_9FIRM|nr:shikimate dehydrogenase [Terrisporobacter mayombei]MCC3867251.1 shikimate dehydrogenase [Terrisporobacter mayombei]WMT81513.1 Shikimate dehydrogenase (NADP(+)) [Terrisporobacter mayombei]
MNINSNTKLIGLFGQPVSQSFSPSIHNYLSQKYKKNNIYMCFEIEKNNLENAAQSIKTFNMKGCNVTIPYKVDIIPYLDKVDKNALLIGAVNTIKNVNNELVGYNTDGIGFIKSLTDEGYDLKDKKIIILGAGGACRSIAVELANKEVSYIEIRNRSEENAKNICNLINSNFLLKADYDTNPVEENDLKSFDILINTTPIGMGSKDCPIDVNINPPKNLLVCDIVYKPYETKLLSWAKNNNLKVVYGINMLINQGLLAYEIWENIKASEDDLEEIKNIYFNSLK